MIGHWGPRETDSRVALIPSLDPTGQSVIEHAASQPEKTAGVSPAFAMASQALDKGRFSLLASVGLRVSVWCGQFVPQLQEETAAPCHRLQDGPRVLGIGKWELGK